MKGDVKTLLPPGDTFVGLRSALVQKNRHEKNVDKVLKKYSALFKRLADDFPAGAQQMSFNADYLMKRMTEHFDNLMQKIQEEIKKQEKVPSNDPNIEGRLMKWISVKDSLPVVEGPVLVWGPYMKKYPRIGFYDPEWEATWRDKEFIEIDVEWWMPLPPPPEDQ